MEGIIFDYAKRRVTLDSNRMGGDFHGEEGVPLHFFKTEESGFNWDIWKIREVTVEGRVTISNQADVNCLAWFIINQVKISGNGFCITPNAVENVCKSFELVMRVSTQFTAVQGSMISICSEGLPDLLKKRLDAICQRVGLIAASG